MKHAHLRRSAFTLTELMVCASLLLTVMSFVASISIRANRLWQDTRHQKIALDELGNQLEYLTTLDVREAQQALAGLEISPDARVVLPRAILKGEIEQDAGSNQLVLTLQIDGEPGTRHSRHAPLTLVGFLPSPPNPEASNRPETDDEQETDDEPKTDSQPEASLQGDQS